MSAENKNYRSIEHIRSKVLRQGGFNEYLQSITTGTARNYRKFLIEYVNEYEKGDKNKLKLISQLVKNRKDTSGLKEQFDSILNRIKLNCLDSNYIDTAEDLEFLLFISLVDIKNKEKIKLSYIDIDFIECSGIIKILIKGKAVSIIISELELFKKMFESKDKLSNEIIFKPNSFIKLIENQFIRSGFEYDKDWKELKNIIKTYFIKSIVG